MIKSIWLWCVRSRRHYINPSIEVWFVIWRGCRLHRTQWSAHHSRIYIRDQQPSHGERVVYNVDIVAPLACSLQQQQHRQFAYNLMTNHDGPASITIRHELGINWLNAPPPSAYYRAMHIHTHTSLSSIYPVHSQWPSRRMRARRSYAKLNVYTPAAAAAAQCAETALLWQCRQKG